MTSVRHLLVLQELDLVLDRLRHRQKEAEDELKTEVSIEALEQALETEAERINEVQLQQRNNQLEFESHQERSQALETWLYDGSITNARDLENIQQEAANVSRQLAQEEAALLDLSIQAEESRTKHADLDRKLTDTRAQWEGRKEELQQVLEGLAEERGSFEDLRTKAAAAVDPASLQRYETLRRSKHGVAVVKVERGLCQGCQMALPTQSLQRVRSGRQQVNCTSCGRLLILS